MPTTRLRERRDSWGRRPRRGDRGGRWRYGEFPGVNLSRFWGVALIVLPLARERRWNVWLRGARVRRRLDAASFCRRSRIGRRSVSRSIGRFASREGRKRRQSCRREVASGVTKKKREKKKVVIDGLGLRCKARKEVSFFCSVNVLRKLNCGRQSIVHDNGQARTVTSGWAKSPSSCRY